MWLITTTDANSKSTKSVKLVYKSIEISYFGGLLTRLPDFKLVASWSKIKGLWEYNIPFYVRDFDSRKTVK